MSERRPEDHVKPRVARRSEPPVPEAPVPEAPASDAPASDAPASGNATSRVSSLRASSSRASSLPEPEFEDLPPGDYLKELRVGNFHLFWSLGNLALLTTIAVAWYLGMLEMTEADRGGVTVRDAPSSWWFPARVAWTLLPISCVVLLLVTVFQSVISSTFNEAGAASNKARFCLALSLISLLAWNLFRFWGGVSFLE